MDLPKFKVTNNAKPIYLPWTFNLLSNEQAKKWEDYKKTSDYRGNLNDPQDQNMRRRTPEADKLRDWCNMNQIGEVSRLPDDLRTIPLGDGMKTTVVDYKYCLPLGETVVEERAILDLKRYKRVALKQKLEPGQTEAKIEYEGFLDIEPYKEKKIEGSNENNMLVCETCGKEFKTKFALSGHSKTHDKNVQLLPPDSESV